MKNKDLLAKLDLHDGFVPLGAIALGATKETYEKREIPDSHRYSMNEIR